MNDLALTLTRAAAAGAITLISPAGWSPRVRRAYVLVPGAAATSVAAVLLPRITADRSPDGEDGPGHFSAPVRHLPGTARVMLPLGLGAVTCGVQAFSLWIDAVLERSLAARGAVHPRRWMALLAVLASLAMDATGEALTSRAADDPSAS